MARLIPTKPERDEQLAADYLKRKPDGSPQYSTAELVAKYKITPQRIGFLLRRQGVPMNRRMKAKRRK